MSDENNNNETPKSKTNISPNEQDNITTITNADNKINSKYNSPGRKSNKNLVINLLSLDRKPSTKTFNDLVESESTKTEGTLKDLIKMNNLKNKTLNRKKRKKGKKGKKVEQKESEKNESILLTEVKKVIKKKEETESHKFLKQKLENLNFSKNLQMAINLGFEKAKKTIKEDLVDKYNINENKKNTFEQLMPNKSKSKNNLKLDINLSQKGIKYKTDKETIKRLKNLKNDEKAIKIKLNKIKENHKLIDEELPIKSDIISTNNRKSNLKKIVSMKNDLLSQLKYNSTKISDILDSNRTINRQLLIKNYFSPVRHISRNSNNNNDLLPDNLSKHFCLSEDQERFNKHLQQIQKEEKIKREKMEKDLKISSEKKSREIELKESKKLQRQKIYLEELKNKEKQFFNKLKEKNDLIMEKSIKFKDEKNPKKKKDYLFYQFQKKFENNEKKLIDKVNMMKKDSLVTKKELEELANKREEQKKILEEGLNERKLKLIKMWKERSQTLPVYKHPIVDMLEDEEYDLLEEEEDKKEKKEKNKKEKKNYQPPKVNIDMNLKKIRESRNIKTNKESVAKTENNNKMRLLKNLDFMANIIESAKEENLERKKLKINKIGDKIKDKEKNDKLSNIINNNKNSKSIDIIESKIRHNYKLHPKPEKPIDYLKEILKDKKINNKNKKDIGVGNILADLEKERKNKSNNNQIMETFNMVKSLNNAIDKKVSEKKEFLKVKGGYLNNTKLGDEVGNLLIESIQNKLSLLKQLNGK